MAMASFMESKSIHSNDNGNTNNVDNGNNDNTNTANHDMIDTNNGNNDNVNMITDSNNSSNTFGNEGTIIIIITTILNTNIIIIEGPVTLNDPSLFISFITSKKSPFVKLQRWRRLSLSSSSSSSSSSSPSKNNNQTNANNDKVEAILQKVNDGNDALEKTLSY